MAARVPFIVCPTVGPGTSFSSGNLLCVTEEAKALLASIEGPLCVVASIEARCAGEVSRPTPPPILQRITPPLDTQLSRPRLHCRD